MLSRIAAELQQLNSNLRFLIKVLNEKLPGSVVEKYPSATRPDADFPFREFPSKKNISPADVVRGPKP